MSADLDFQPEPTHDAGLDFQPEPPRSTLQQTGRVVSKALGYPGGVVRAGVGSAIGALGGPKTVTLDDLKNALNPTTTDQPPGTGEMLKRAGMGPGPKFSDLADVNTHGTLGLFKAAASLYADPNKPHPFYQPEKGGMLDPTLRGTLGAWGDMASDPLTHGKLVPPILGNPATKVAGRAGPSMYKKAIQGIVTAGERNMNPKIAQTLMDAGVWGEAPSIEHGLDQIAQVQGAKRNAIEAATDATGNHASLDAAHQPMWDNLSNQADKRLLSVDQAQKIGQDATQVAIEGGPDAISIRDTRGLKTQAGQSQAANRFSTFAPTAANPEKEAAYGALQGGYKGEAEAGVGRGPLGPQGAADYREANQLLGDSINPKIRAAAGKATDKFDKAQALSPADIKMALLGGLLSQGGMGHTVAGGIKVLAIKKAIDALHLTSTGTGVGLGLNAVGNSGAGPVLDSALRQALQRNFTPYPETK